MTKQVRGANRPTNAGLRRLFVSAAVLLLLAVLCAAPAAAGEVYPTGAYDMPDISMPNLQMIGAVDLNPYTSSAQSASGIEEYDLRTLGYITDIRNQEIYGSCWAFATIAAIESSILMDYPAENKDTLDLSELQLVYFFYNRDGVTYGNPILDEFSGLKGDNIQYNGNEWYMFGGNHVQALLHMVTGIGVVDETTVPYSEASESLDLDPQYAPSDRYIVTDARYLTFTNEDLIKQHLMEYGAGAVSYYSTEGQEDACNEVEYEGSTITTYYNSTAEMGVDHAVAIVGWNDNIPSDLFTDVSTGTHPGRNGAWLVKNSWGTGFGDSGYFWLSYDDASILGNVIVFYEVTPADEIDTIYQYDGTSSFNVIATDELSATGANHFKTTKNEEITAVSFMTSNTNVRYTVSVKSNGETLATETGTALVSGYHTVPLTSPVPLPADSEFTVEVTYAVTEESLNNEGLEYLEIPIDQSGDMGVAIVTSAYQEGQGSISDSAGTYDGADFSGNLRIKAYGVAAELSSCEHSSYKPWTSTTSLPSESGSYSLTNDVTLGSTWDVPGTVDLCLNGHVIEQTAVNCSVIRVPQGSTLNLYDCGNTPHYFVDDGNIYYQSILHTSPDTDDYYEIDGGVITGARFNGYRGGGGVCVDGGTFNMYGGNIAANHETAPLSDGCGVYVAGNGEFNLYEGAVALNTATSGGGVYVVDGSFNMYGGTVLWNHAATGGGVFVKDDSSFTMSGGFIEGNTADSEGGGVNVFLSTFDMTGGSIVANGAGSGGGIFSSGELTVSNGVIAENTATYGAGVFISCSTFTMAGGEVALNIADWSGGGVEIYDGTFTLSGGNISNNFAESIGGGVTMTGYTGLGTFTMDGGSIYENTANITGGGGVYINSNGVFTMNSGTISDNVANYLGGGGVYVSDGTTFTMNGGDILRNTVVNSGNGGGYGIDYNHGGGVYVSQGNFVMNGGFVADNIAETAGGVYINQGSTLVMNGTATINDNNELYLDYGKNITIIGDEFTGSALNITGATFYPGTDIVNVISEIKASEILNQFALKSTHPYSLTADDTDNVIRIATSGGGEGEEDPDTPPLVPMIDLDTVKVSTHSTTEAKLKFNLTADSIKADTVIVNLTKAGETVVLQSHPLASLEAGDGEVCLFTSLTAGTAYNITISLTNTTYNGVLYYVHPYTAPIITGIALEGDVPTTLAIGETVSLSAVVMNGTDTRLPDEPVAFTLEDDTGVLTETGNGKYTAVKAGTAVIKISAVNNAAVFEKVIITVEAGAAPELGESKISIHSTTEVKLKLNLSADSLRADTVLVSLDKADGTGSISALNPEAFTTLNAGEGGEYLFQNLEAGAAYFFNITLVNATTGGVYHDELPYVSPTITGILFEEAVPTTLTVGDSFVLKAVAINGTEASPVKLPDEPVTITLKDDAGVLSDNGNGEYTAVKAGTAEITATAKGVSKTVTITVSGKLIPVPEIIAGTILTYSGEPQNAPFVEHANYTIIENATATAAGTYLAKFHLNDPATTAWNLESGASTDDITVAWEIQPKSLENAVLTFGIDGGFYDSSVKTQTFTVKDKDGKLVSETDYTYTGTLVTATAGTYPITITGQNNYNGEVTGEWAIAKATPTTDLFTYPAGTTTVTYDGNPHGVEVTLSETAQGLTADDFAVTYNGIAGEPTAADIYQVNATIKETAVNYTAIDVELCELKIVIMPGVDESTISFTNTSSTSVIFAFNLTEVAGADNVLIELGTNAPISTGAIAAGEGFTQEFSGLIAGTTYPLNLTVLNAELGGEPTVYNTTFTTPTLGKIELSASPESKVLDVYGVKTGQITATVISADNEVLTGETVTWTYPESYLTVTTEGNVAQIEANQAGEGQTVEIVAHAGLAQDEITKPVTFKIINTRPVQPAPAITAPVKEENGNTTITADSGSTITVDPEDSKTAIITDANNIVTIKVTFEEDQTSGSIVQGNVTEVVAEYSEADVAPGEGMTGAVTFTMNLTLKNVTTQLPMMNSTINETAKEALEEENDKFKAVAMITAESNVASINGNLTQVELIFSVPTTWFNAVDEIYFFHYKNGDFERLEKINKDDTSKVTRGTDVTTIKVTGTSFSTYGIAGKETETDNNQDNNNNNNQNNNNNYNGGGSGYSGGGSSTWSTPTPTPTVTPTAQPTETVPTTTQPVATEQPKSPGFGVLAVLAGLGAAGAVLRRK